MKIAILGAGSWGTAFASQMADKHEDVVLWARNSTFLHELSSGKKNTTYLPTISLSPQLAYTDDLQAACEQATVVIFATPSHAMRELAQRAAAYISSEAMAVSLAKGLEEKTFLRMSQILDEELPHLQGKVAAVSGPSHAEEVALSYPTAVVVASTSMKTAEQIQEICMLPHFRLYTSQDIIGVELGGALKNIIALGAGMVEGLGFGDNTQAALMTRGLTEIVRLGVSAGADAATFSGLTGIGDLMVTCMSRHSRNRQAGISLAKGKSITQIQKDTRMVIEGVRATNAARDMAFYQQVNMPITQEIWNVLYQNKQPRDAVLELMTRRKKTEAEE